MHPSLTYVTIFYIKVYIIILSRGHIVRPTVKILFYFVGNKSNLKSSASFEFIQYSYSYRRKISNIVYITEMIGLNLIEMGVLCDSMGDQIEGVWNVILSIIFKNQNNVTTFFYINEHVQSISTKGYLTWILI